ncbi:MAG TPA: hypothetical protein VF532_02170 [Candidatus Angelobacter sp.]
MATAKLSPLPVKYRSRRPAGRLLLLGFLFIAALAYHLRVTTYREPSWFGVSAPHRPFYVSQPGLAGKREHNSISFLDSHAVKAGL